ncbi:uncharacterized protein M421DRAFT_255420 [Didymella exigua CBS 183.55]|uniref:Uncharacterized protein n=1 Tax=Didymella exigua CBS 183.55 TaxID=1150837 RepID=A0A6A5RZL2_9PLEO|nr:uncharacterized protein M421DRAFT_255420 [Didymella exigua CBS 183.55]KAF1933043.1 hypothetical protein M421DRAFT_255420 [Didymella exigua CBS 183.55]
MPAATGLVGYTTGSCIAAAFGNGMGPGTGRKGRQNDFTKFTCREACTNLALPVSHASWGTETRHSFLDWRSQFCMRATRVVTCSHIAAPARRSSTEVDHPWSLARYARHRNIRNGRRHGRPECDMSKRSTLHQPDTRACCLPQNLVKAASHDW